MRTAVPDRECRIRGPSITASSDDSPSPRPPYSLGIGMASTPNAAHWRQASRLNDSAESAATTSYVERLAGKRDGRSLKPMQVLVQLHGSFTVSRGECSKQTQAFEENQQETGEPPRLYRAGSGCSYDRERGLCW